MCYSNNVVFTSIIGLVGEDNMESVAKKRPGVRLPFGWGPFLLVAQVPGALLAALEAGNAQGLQHILPAFVLGFAGGAFFYPALCRLVGALNRIKVCALLFPWLLCVAHFAAMLCSPWVFRAFFALWFALLYIAFVRPRYSGVWHLSAILFMLAFYSVLAWVLYDYGYFSPDSYSYYEISKHLFSGSPFEINTVRQYGVFTQYGISFPYLYPLLVALMNLCGGFGIYSGVVVNVALCAATLVVLWRLSVRLAGVPVVGAVAAVLLVINQQYLNELMAARAIVLGILCTLLVLYHLLRLPKAPLPTLFLAGLFAGAGCVARFDGLAVAAIGFLAVVVFQKEGKVKGGLCYLAGMLLPMLPWMLYSLVVFGKPWMSDNTGNLFAVQPANPQTYVGQAVVVPTLWNNQALWLRTLVTEKIPGVGMALANAFQQAGGLWFLLFGAAGLVTVSGKKPVQVNPGNREQWLPMATGAVAVACLAKTAALVLVGYGDLRYHAETILLAVLMAGACIYQVCARRVKDTGTIAKAAAIFGLCVLVALTPALKFVRQGDMGRATLLYADVLEGRTARVTELYGVVTAEKEEPRVLFLNGAAPQYEFGAYTGITTFASPFSEDETAVRQLIEEYIKPDYIVAASLPQGFAEAFDLEEVYRAGDYNIYKAGVFFAA